MTKKSIVTHEMEVINKIADEEVTDSHIINEAIEIIDDYIRNLEAELRKLKEN